MDEWVLGMLLSLLCCGFLFLAYRLERCHTSIGHMAESLHMNLKTDIENVSLNTSDSFIDNIKEELLDVVNETINNMRPPNIADHLGGILQQFAQMKMMKMMQKEGLFPASAPNLPGASTINPLEDEMSWHDDAPDVQ
jgi:hypothetical protein